MIKTTLVIGASPDPSRYSYMATNMLHEYKHIVVPYGIKKGKINDHEIINQLPTSQYFDTITLYINPSIQKQFYNYIIGIKPKRVIFNPGTENAEFEKMLTINNIEALHACTMVMLRTQQF